MRYIGSLCKKVVSHRISLSNSTQLTKRTFKLAYESRQPKDNLANMKREELYRRNYKTETEFFNGVHNYIAFYNSERPHSLLRYQTPDKYEEMYYFYNPNRTCVVQEEQ